MKKVHQLLFVLKTVVLVIVNYCYKQNIVFIRKYLQSFRLKPTNTFAVTGTNGKTSVADIFYQILRINNLPAASIGTLV